MTAVVAVIWGVVLVLILRHRIFVSLDTVSNYAHVWYVAQQLHDGARVPFRMPLAGHGQALAFPYGLLPWLSAALLWPLLGEWVVTVWLVIGMVGLIAATFFAFPELRSGWWGAAVLVNPALVAAAIIGQLPFVWAAAFLLAGVGCWRRGKRWQAALLVGIGQATHPAVVLPMGALLVAWWLRWEPDRRALLGWYALAAAVAAPAAILVVISPVFVESSLWTRLAMFILTLAVRALVVVIPWGLVALRSSAWSPSWLPPRSRMGASSFGILLILNLVALLPLQTDHAWGAVIRRPSAALSEFINSPSFTPGATYRFLRSDLEDGKLGMYELLTHGGRLDSEFFPESIDRRSWPDLATYSSFLRRRQVDYVILWRSYDRQFHTNEHRLLRHLVQLGSTCHAGLVGIKSVASDPDYQVYRVDRSCSSTGAGVRPR